jgi:hypothetical protein
MESNDLLYGNLVKQLGPLLQKGRTESATFLNWFLENIYRLDSVDSDDCICDKGNDKGIDGIYVDMNNEEIHFLQSKIRQKDSGTIGDVSLKTFAASVRQFDTAEKVQAMGQGDANSSLKDLLNRLEVADLIGKGYKPIGIYITNEVRDDASDAYLKIDDSVRIYDRDLIAANYVEANQKDGVKGTFEFDASYVEPLKIKIGQGEVASEVFIFPALALQLVMLNGIADTTLFTKNVRFDLGNTPVNKSIKKSIEDKSEHINFTLFHNGIIILCDKAELTDKILRIENYSVVNGAQSLTTFYNSKSKLTDNLRVLVRVIALQSDGLARKITEFSNNQNAIKPRDLRSNHALMTRLQNEFSTKNPEYFFEIKRGEIAPDKRTIISNDEAGRDLLAFDLLEPYSCHQVYKIFDEKYAEIFGRIEVDSDRVIFIRDLSSLVGEAVDGIENKPLAHYALTRFFLLNVLSRILRGENKSAAYIKKPTSFEDGEKRQRFLTICSGIVKSMVIDLNYEVKEAGAAFDYKSILKSPKQVEDLGDKLIRSYQKDVARGKADNFGSWK